MIDNIRTPKSLLVIGNGFDLSCGLPSNYVTFLRWVLSHKTDIDQSEAIAKIKQGIEKYLNSWNFRHDPQQDLTIKIGNENRFIQDINIWYLIFVYKNMIFDNDWHLVENQIANELLKDTKGLNIIEKIGDTLLSIYREDRGDGGRTPKYCINKASVFDDREVIIRFYELLAYCLYYKNLDILSYENRVVFQELRAQVKQLGGEYSELSSQNKINKEPYSSTFENKITSILFPLVSQSLLCELMELELDFKKYLKQCIDTNHSNYPEVAGNYFKGILTPVNVDRGYSEMVDFNILSFNYTTPWELSDNEIFNKIFDSVNIHGQISNDDGIVFGIDDEKIAPTQMEFMFSKVARTLDLITLSNHRKSLDELLSTNIENVVFYGHSLSIADYGYFRMIFDKYVDNSEVKFYFTFKVYKGTTEYKERKKLVKNISEIFGKYSIDKEKNTDIFKNLIQNQRIKIISL